MNDEPATSRTTETQAAVPLHELLRSIPADARLIVEAELSSTSHPVGRLAHTAADEIERLRRGLNEVRDWLNKPEWGSWPYTEGTGLYDDKEQALFNIAFALGEL